jgi:hypothetical protein
MLPRMQLRAAHVGALWITCLAACTGRGASPGLAPPSEAAASTTRAGAQSLEQSRRAARAGLATPPAAAVGGGGTTAVQMLVEAGVGGMVASAATGGAGSPGNEPARLLASAGVPAASAGMLEAPVMRGPYFSSGDWHGYLWVAQHGAGTTLTTTGFDAEQLSGPVCMRGVVAATPDGTGNAILGVNLSQSRSADMTVQTVAPTRDGIAVGLLNRGGSLVRLQVQALDGADNARARWCAPLSGSGGFVPWSALDTACWDGSGARYRGEPVSGAMLLVPGTTGAPTPYDVCLVSLAESSAAPAQPAAGSGA